MSCVPRNWARPAASKDDEPLPTLLYFSLIYLTSRVWTWKCVPRKDHFLVYLWPEFISLTQTYLWLVNYCLVLSVLFRARWSFSELITPEKPQIMHFDVTMVWVIFRPTPGVVNTGTLYTPIVMIHPYSVDTPQRHDPCLINTPIPALFPDQVKLRSQGTGPKFGTGRNSSFFACLHGTVYTNSSR